MLIHQLWWTGFTASPAHNALIAAAIVLLGDPGSRRRLILFAAVAVVVEALDWPRVADHLLVVAAAAAAALLTRGRWEAVAPFVRAEAVLLYAAAAFAKLNTTFLDPAVSSAGPMVRHLPLAGDWAVGPAIYGTVTVEAALALLLLVPRTRRAGVAVGLLFHALLALAGNVPFAAVMAATYVAFVPGPRVRPVPVAALGAAWLVGIVLDPAPGVTSGWMGDGMRWVVAAALVVAATRVGPPVPGAARVRPALAVLLGLLALNAAGPYLGYKRIYTFAPFSDLHTEPGRWNHLVVPEAVRLRTSRRRRSIAPSSRFLGRRFAQHDRDHPDASLRPRLRL